MSGLNKQMWRQLYLDKKLLKDSTLAGAVPNGRSFRPDYIRGYTGAVLKHHMPDRLRDNVKMTHTVSLPIRGAIFSNFNAVFRKLAFDVDHFS